MRSLYSAWRSWCPHQRPRFTGLFIRSLKFSTTPTPPTNQQLKMPERVPDYGRWTKDALIKRIRHLEELNGIKEQQPAASATSSDQGLGLVTPATEEAAAASSDEVEEGLPRKKKSKKDPKKKEERSFDSSKYSTRLIALKLAYLGKNYGGFEFQATSDVPTIEEELWKALVKGCLISPENPGIVDFEPWEYSKCGRTDRGVSAFGQVIGIRVRSNRPLPKRPEETAVSSTTTTNNEAVEGTPARDAQDAESADATEAAAPKREFNDHEDELPYARILNNLLPPDIRILAWCPTTPADFSARKDCVERQYRYFFTQPAYSPNPRNIEDPKWREKQKNGTMPKDGWLDIEAMRKAAKKFEGLHDFRNFCKVDPSKSHQSFHRRIFESDVVEVTDAGTAMPHLSKSDYLPVPADDSPSSKPKEPSTTVSLLPEEEDFEEERKFPKVYCYRIRGSAFLWHQIRCMVNILFLVGQGLEDVSAIDKMLDAATEPRRPAYNLASDVPLVLWDCVFPKDRDDPTCKEGMEWIHVGEECPVHAHGPGGLVDHIWEVWRGHKVDELLSTQLLNLVTSQADLTRRLNTKGPQYLKPRQKAFEGGDRARTVGKYVPLLKREKLASPEEFYEKFAKKKGFESAAHRQQAFEQKRVEAIANKMAAASGGA